MVTCGEYARQNNWEKKQDKIIGEKKNRRGTYLVSMNSVEMQGIMGSYGAEEVAVLPRADGEDAALFVLKVFLFCFSMC